VCTHTPVVQRQRGLLRLLLLLLPKRSSAHLCERKTTVPFRGVDIGTVKREFDSSWTARPNRAVEMSQSRAGYPRRTTYAHFVWLATGNSISNKAEASDEQRTATNRRDGLWRYGATSAPVLRREPLLGSVLSGTRFPVLNQEVLARSVAFRTAQSKLVGASRSDDWSRPTSESRSSALGAIRADNFGGIRGSCSTVAQIIVPAANCSSARGPNRRPGTERSSYTFRHRLRKDLP
jgi:hypothetical protein